MRPIPPPEPQSVSPTVHPAASTTAGRGTCVVMFIDVVESVRLIESDEAGTIDKWWQIEGFINRELAPKHDGRIVKLLGDGMLLEFEEVRKAISAAFQIQDFVSSSDRGDGGVTSSLKLRISIDYGEVLRKADDIYGHRVNIAARLLSLADAGEIVVSADVHDQFTAGLDADIEDLGYCYLKNITDPVRAFRISMPESSWARAGRRRMADIRPVVAILPFIDESATDALHHMGDFLAEELIHSLSRMAEIAVISWLSTAAFRGRHVTLSEVRSYLHATYVVSGRVRSDKSKVLVSVELADVETGRVVWTDRLHGTVTDLSRGQALVSRIVGEIGSAILLRELQRARMEPVPNVQTYTLMLGAIALMHRMGRTDFMEARTMLEAVIARASHQPVAQAWLAKWHVLRVQQGWSEDVTQDARAALDLTKRALNSDPESSLALAVDGLVHTNLLKNFEIARERYDRALLSSPNDSFALLLRGVLHAFCDEGREAVRDTAQAVSLSPLDPHRYFYDSLAASAELTYGRYKRAAGLARRSLRANRAHASTLRVLTVAEWQLGHEAEAREAARQLLQLEPTLTVEGYRSRAPSAGFRVCELITSSLAQAGIPLR
jgi:adenylate cyclase